MTLACAVVTEQGSPASHMPVAKIIGRYRKIARF